MHGTNPCIRRCVHGTSRGAQNECQPRQFADWDVTTWKWRTTLIAICVWQEEVVRFMSESKECISLANQKPDVPQRGALRSVEKLSKTLRCVLRLRTPQENRSLSGRMLFFAPYFNCFTCSLLFVITTFGKNCCRSTIAARGAESTHIGTAQCTGVVVHPWHRLSDDALAENITHRNLCRMFGNAAVEPTTGCLYISCSLGRSGSSSRGIFICWWLQMSRAMCAWWVS